MQCLDFQCVLMNMRIKGLQPSDNDKTTGGSCLIGLILVINAEQEPPPQLWIHATNPREQRL